MNAVVLINRYSEQGRIPVRSERFYEDAGQWFFSVRSGLDLGPYETFSDARQALTDYIKDSLLDK